MITFYQYNGSVEKTETIDEKTIKGCHGMKVKCTLKDGSEKIGYANTYYSFETNSIEMQKKLDYIALEKVVFLSDKPYDIRFDKEKVMISDILCIDAIMYSGPRWGNAPTNEFKLKKK